MSTDLDKKALSAKVAHGAPGILLIEPPGTPWHAVLLTPTILSGLDDLEPH